MDPGRWPIGNTNNTIMCKYFLNRNITCNILSINTITATTMLYITKIDRSLIITLIVRRDKGIRNHSRFPFDRQRHIGPIYDLNFRG